MQTSVVNLLHVFTTAIYMQIYNKHLFVEVYLYIVQHKVLALVEITVGLFLTCHWLEMILECNL